MSQQNRTRKTNGACAFEPDPTNEAEPLKKKSAASLTGEVVERGRYRAKEIAEGAEAAPAGPMAVEVQAFAAPELEIEPEEVAAPKTPAVVETRKPKGAAPKNAEHMDNLTLSAACCAVFFAVFIIATLVISG